MLLTLIRHAETTKNIGNRFDSAAIYDKLTPDGEAQLSSIADFLLNRQQALERSIVITGPRTRAILSAERIACVLSVQCLLEDSLVPIDPGILRGITESQAWQSYHDLMQRRVDFRDGRVDGYQIRFPEGDSIAEYEHRIRISLLDIVGRYSDYDQVYVVTHRSVILSLLNITRKMLECKNDNSDFRYFDTPTCCIDGVCWHDGRVTSITRYGGYDSWRSTV